MSYLDTFVNAYSGYFNYFIKEITFQNGAWWHNYFFWLVVVSAVFIGLEWLRPWRVEQPKFRKDFWLDFFYMFFNFFLFSLIIYNAVSSVFVQLFNEGILAISSIDLQKQNPMQSLPYWSVLLIGFLVRDFVQWNIHRLLHRVPWLWEYHKVHHSVEQMGVAAHLRYHWMENVVYRFIEYIPLALLGIGLYDFFIMHIFALTIGHYNHSNFIIPSPIKGGIIGGFIGLFVGVLVLELATQGIFISLGIGIIIGILVHNIWKYIFNSPEMHIWHHSYELPKHSPYGVNYGLTFSFWDYIFKTDYIPHDGRDIRLGFPDIEAFPKTFLEQATKIK